jgi:endo-1,4-beta-xylanase
VTATRPVSGWRVTLSLPAGATVTNAWSATLNGASGTVTASNVAYNGTLGTGGSTQFGFQANGSPTGITSTCSAA